LIFPTEENQETIGVAFLMNACYSLCAAFSQACFSKSQMNRYALSLPLNLDKVELRSIHYAAAAVSGSQKSRLPCLKEE
jgi:hypothetical protein